MNKLVLAEKKDDRFMVVFETFNYNVFLNNVDIPYNATFSLKNPVVFSRIYHEKVLKEIEHLIYILFEKVIPLNSKIFRINDITKYVMSNEFTINSEDSQKLYSLCNEYKALYNLKWSEQTLFLAICDCEDFTT